MLKCVSLTFHSDEPEIAMRISDVIKGIKVKIIKIKGIKIKIIKIKGIKVKIIKIKVKGS